MAEKEKKISVNMIAEQAGISAQTVKQLCKTDQIPMKCYHIYDEGHDTETWLFYPSLTLKAIKQWEKEQKAKKEKI